MEEIDNVQHFLLVLGSLDVFVIAPARTGQYKNMRNKSHAVKKGVHCVVMPGHVLPGAIKDQSCVPLLVLDLLKRSLK